RPAVGGELEVRAEVEVRVPAGGRLELDDGPVLEDEVEEAHEGPRALPSLELELELGADGGELGALGEEGVEEPAPLGDRLVDLLGREGMTLHVEERPEVGLEDGLHFLARELLSPPPRAEVHVERPVE